MYYNTKEEKYYLYTYKDGEWILKTTFQDLEDLLDYVSRICKRNLFSETEKTALSNKILDNLNMNGKDLQRYEGFFGYCSWYYVRDYMVRDGEGRIIDLRNYKEEIERRFHELETSGKKRRLIYWRKSPAYIFRKDPVPYTGRNWFHMRGCRKEKNWFRNYKLDQIPEYQEYVRHKARVPDVWDTEPFQDDSKSWKDNCKCKYQWQKHKK